MFLKIFKKWGISVISIIIGGVIIFISLIVFQIASEKTLEQFIHKNMVEINHTASLTLANGIKSCQDLLTSYSESLISTEGISSTDILALLGECSKDARFERLTFVDSTGKAYSSFFGVHQLDSLTALPNLNSSDPLVGQPRSSSTGQETVDISVPVYRHNRQVGRLIATIDDRIFNTIYRATGLEGDASLCLFSADGTVISTFSNRPLDITSGDNVFNFIANPNLLLLEGSLETYKKDVQAGRSGWIIYKEDGERICMNYEPFNLNGWYMFVTATDHTLDNQVASIRTLAFRLTLAIVAVVVIVAAIVMLQRIKEQQRIDALKNTYSVAIRKTNDLFYEADIDSDLLIDYSESSNTAIWEAAPKNYSKALEQIASVCSPEYRQEFLDTFLPQNIKIKIKQGISSINFEYKILLAENVVRWISATFVPVTDGSSNSTKLICMENDITDQKLKEEQLNLSATTDGLTGLYNRVTTESYIETFLNGEGFSGHHALLLIDIDYFKSVNDTLGHAMGDKILTEYAMLLQHIFRKSDLLGRMGGDEFAILLKDCGDIDLVLEKAEEICSSFKRKHYLNENPDKAVQTSASIGISIYSNDGKTFGDLYKAADAALYISKGEGRDRFTFAK